MTLVTNLTLLLGALLILSARDNVPIVQSLQTILKGDTTLASATSSAPGSLAGSFTPLSNAGAPTPPSQGVAL